MATKKTRLVSELTIAMEQGLKENSRTRTAKIDVDCTRIIIGGRVPTYYHKQIVINTVQRVSGQMDIVDDLLVD